MNTNGSPPTKSDYHDEREEAMYLMLKDMHSQFRFQGNQPPGQ